MAAVVVVVVVVVAVVAAAVVGIKAVDDAHTRMLLILSSSLDLHARPRGDQIACLAGEWWRSGTVIT
jgi:hypothetical protein